VRLRWRTEQIIEGRPAELADLRRITGATEAAGQPLALMAAPAADTCEAHLYACDHCPHRYVSTAAGREGEPCRACPPWGQLKHAGHCTLDLRPLRR
jgi:hypothetical protein